MLGFKNFLMDEEGVGVVEMVLIVVVLIGLVLIFKVFVRSAKKGRLGKTPIFDTKTNLPVDYDLSGMMSNAKYVDKFGTVVTPCKPAGRIKIGEDEIDVVAKSID